MRGMPSTYRYGVRWRAGQRALGGLERRPRAHGEVRGELLRCAYVQVVIFSLFHAYRGKVSQGSVMSKRGIGTSGSTSSLGGEVPRSGRLVLGSLVLGCFVLVGFAMGSVAMGSVAMAADTSVDDDPVQYDPAFLWVADKGDTASARAGNSEAQGDAPPSDEDNAVPEKAEAVAP